MKAVYIVEDDENIRNLLTVALTGFGYRTEGFETAEEALARMEETLPDIVVLDWMLPGMDGMTALKIIRRSPILQALPVLMLTAKERELDKVEGLDAGADDYMVKPFGILELSARIRSLLRRTKRESEDNCQLKFGNVLVNRRTREVFCRNNPVELTRKEYELLTCLMENSSRILSREELLDQIWGYTYEGESRTLDMHIRTLRQKLGEEGGCIKTIRGVGYRLISGIKTEDKF